MEIKTLYRELLRKKVQKNEWVERGLNNYLISNVCRLKNMSYNIVQPNLHDTLDLLVFEVLSLGGGIITFGFGDTR